MCLTRVIFSLHQRWPLLRLSG